MHTCMCVYCLLSIVLAIKVFCASIWISGFFSVYVKNVMSILIRITLNLICVCVCVCACVAGQSFPQY